MAQVVISGRKKTAVKHDPKTGSFVKATDTSEMVIEHEDMRVLMVHAKHGNHNGVLQENPNAQVKATDPGKPTWSGSLAEWIEHCKNPANIPVKPIVDGRTPIPKPTPAQLDELLKPESPVVATVEHPVEHEAAH